MEKETFVSNPGVHRFSSNGFQSDALGTSRRAPRSHGNHGGRGRKGSSSHSSSDKTLDGHSRSRNDPGMARKGSTLATGRQGPVDAGTREQVHVPHVAPKELLETIGWNSFFYEETTNLTAALWIKRAYAIVVLINVILLSLDWDFVQSVMPLHLGRETMDPDTLTLLEYIPEHYHKLCMYLWMLHLVGLGVDIFPRFQAFGVFFWYIQFAHSTSCLFDGEDIISRLLAFYLVFFPPKRETSWPMWPFRLVQFQMCLIYFSTGGLKLSGPSWQNGTALYKVTQEDSLYGGYWNPDWMFGYTAPLKFLTHATMCLELGGVVLIWFKETRIPTLLAIIGLHVSIDASMSLNTFHWIMIVGWCSFLVQPAEESKQLSWAWLFQTTRKFVIQLASKEKVD